MLKATLFALLLTIATALAKPGVETAREIPFKFVDGFIIVNARLGEGAKPVSLLVDSGASTSVLSMEAAERLRVPLLAPEPVQGVGAQSVAYHIPPLRATSGKTHLTNIPFVLDLSNAARICSHPVDGLLGMDFFAGRIVQIDFNARLLRLLSTSEHVTADLQMPLRIRNGVICTPVGVDGSAHRWTRLDTGCNDALHWVMQTKRPKQRKSRTSLGFLTDPTQMFQASVQLGERTIKSVLVAPHSQEIFSGEAGLLGNGILSRYTVTIDTRERRILLQETEAVSNHD